MVADRRQQQAPPQQRMTQRVEGDRKLGQHPVRTLQTKNGTFTLTPIGDSRPQRPAHRLVPIGPTEQRPVRRPQQTTVPLPDGGIRPGDPEYDEEHAASRQDFVSSRRNDFIVPSNAFQFLNWASGKYTGSRGDRAIDETVLPDSDFLHLRSVALKVHEEGRSQLDYGDWGYQDRGGGLLKAMVRIEPDEDVPMLQQIRELASLSFTDPNFRMGTLLGASTVEVRFNEETGYEHLYIVDEYDFNVGKRGTLLKEAFMAEDMGDIELAQEKRDEAFEGTTWFEQVRILAFAMFDQDDLRMKVDMDLGPVDDEVFKGFEEARENPFNVQTQ